MTPGGRRSPIRVLLVDGDEDVRSLVETMIEVDERFELAASTHSPREAIDLVAIERPDAVVLDLSLAEMDGLEALPQLDAACAGVVVVYSAFPDPLTLLAAVERGADAYVDTGRAWSELLPTVAAAHEAALDEEDLP